MNGPRYKAGTGGPRGEIETLRRVCIVGLGYVGLPTAAILATRGMEVVGVDVEPGRVRIVNRGGTPIMEPDLEKLVRAAVASGRLRAQMSIAPADAFVIAVPTPIRGDHEPDLSYLLQAAASIASVLVAGNLVILESTSPVGTTDALCEWLAEARPDLSFPHSAGAKSDIRVAYSPERVLPGEILDELVNNDRIIGGVTRQCALATRSFYEKFVRGECSVTTARTAELVKLTENSYRDVNIAFANEISLVCDALGVDPWELVELANRHPRVEVLRPGPGVGGHCVAVDPWFVVHSAPKLTPLIRAARRVNDERPQTVVDRVLATCRELECADVACLGLAYKANVGDLRESPAVEIVTRLQGEVSGRVLVVEPYIVNLPDELMKEGVELVGLDEALVAADVVVLLTDHREFLEVEPRRFPDKRFVDTRGVWRGR